MSHTLTTIQPYCSIIVAMGVGIIYLVFSLKKTFALGLMALCAIVGWVQNIYDVRGAMFLTGFLGASVLYFSPSFFKISDETSAESLSAAAVPLSMPLEHTSKSQKSAHGESQNPEVMVGEKGSPWIKGASFGFIVVFFIGLLHHKIPGFYNFLAIQPMFLSDLSMPYNMWFNFDRTFAAMILWTCSAASAMGPFSARSSQQLSCIGTTLRRTLPIFLICVGLTSVLGMVLGHIQWDVKWPSIFGTWSLNNLFFICFAEEVFFRAFLQTQIKSKIPSKWLRYCPHVMLSALCFGLDHALKGGMIYGLLSCIIGGFYGYVYDKTQRLECSILFHFLINLVHLIFFTYPASMSFFKSMG